MKKFLIKMFVPKKFKELFKKTQGKLKGCKTYITCSMAVLAGLIGLVDQVTAMNGIADLLPFIKNIHSNTAFIALMGGIGGMNIRAGIEKTKIK